MQCGHFYLFVLGHLDCLDYLVISRLNDLEPPFIIFIDDKDIIHITIFPNDYQLDKIFNKIIKKDPMYFPYFDCCSNARYSIRVYFEGIYNNPLTLESFQPIIDRAELVEDEKVKKMVKRYHKMMSKY